MRIEAEASSPLGAALGEHRTRERARREDGVERRMRERGVAERALCFLVDERGHARRALSLHRHLFLAEVLEGLLESRVLLTQREQLVGGGL